MYEGIVTTFGFPLTGYAALLPVAFLLIGLFWGLFADFLPGRKRFKNQMSSAVGFVCASLAAGASAIIYSGTELFGGRFWYTFDARFAATVICVLVALWCLWTLGSGVGRTREAVSLAMASSIGAVLAVAATDIIVLILVVELASMPSYVLIGYRRYRIRGLEAALKYFLLSVMSTLIMIYGFSFLVGLSAGSSFTDLATSLPSTPLTFVAFGLVLLGLFAKLSVAPFHWWAPDAYEGSEPWTLAFVSVIPKVAVALVMLRLVISAAASVPLLHVIVTLMAILSMVIGSFAALKKNDVRRMMAYSGVVNGGYVLIALSIVTLGGASVAAAFNAALFFIVSYAIATMGLLLIVAHEGGKVSDLNGLSQRNPFMAWSLAILVLSMIGAPPFLGFFAKLNLFLAAIDAGQIEIVILAVLVVVVSAFYYLRLIRAAFFGKTESKDFDDSSAEAVEALELERAQNSPLEKADHTEKSPYSLCATLAIAVIVLAVAVMGVLYSPIMSALTGG
ncbi:MAG: NADH-quinone oxidoreductase subunit N [Coriobacteriia bacterium]|nr:NADH-quinone oxidoreductase subunit N [Coriobacteriia bacterium]